MLLIYKTLLPSVRLCGHSQMEALAAMGRIDYRHCQERQMTQDDLRWADIVLLGRMDSGSVCQLAEWLRKAGKYIIYILDDDLLNIPETLTSAKHYREPGVQRHIRRLLELSHAVLSPSPLLLKKYATDGREALLTREPSVSPVPYEPHDPNVPVKIGFAGSVDRAGDVEKLLSGALRQIKAEYGDRVEIEFFGFQISLAAELNAKVRPYCSSYDDYREALNAMAWDIGLAPMPDAPFYACKHYNKFVEYAAAGVVGVFSDLEPYTQLKQGIGVGVFCENETEAWVAALRDLLDHREKREELRRQVCQCAMTTVGVETIARELGERMAEIWNWRAPKKQSPYPLRSWKIRVRAEEYWLALRVYKWSIFRRVIEKLLGRG